METDPSLPSTPTPPNNKLAVGYKASSERKHTLWGNSELIQRAAYGQPYTKMPTSATRLRTVAIITNN